jgi:riboflavin-specific deaminase-like protein
MRAACDAVVVGIGTILRDDPQLTVRMVPGASPLRVVLDSALRVPMKAKVLSADAATLVITSDRSDPAKRENLKAVGVGVHVVPTTARGLDIPAVLAQLRDAGVESVLIEGGAKVVTSVLAAALVDASWWARPRRSWAMVRTPSATSVSAVLPRQSASSTGPCK